ncbi:MAG: hypothetical protein AAGJ18_05965 [Bacteroidota bacterium]
MFSFRFQLITIYLFLQISIYANNKTDLVQLDSTKYIKNAFVDFPNQSLKSIMFIGNEFEYGYANYSFALANKKKKKWTQLILHLAGGAAMGAATGYAVVKYGPKTEDPSNKDLAIIQTPIWGTVGLMVGGIIFTFKADKY